MIYLRKISSLEESASTQVAINLCQENGFKEVAMRLERPTYGAFVYKSRNTPYFITEKLSTWTKDKVDEDDPESDEFFYRFTEEVIEEWHAAVDEQCQRLTAGIPGILKQGVQAWINRIAWEFLSYSRRQEVLFGVSPYFLMNFLTLGDWTNAGRLDEKKLAERLLKDERFTVFQRYCIACVYCLHGNIVRLWMGLTQEEKRLATRHQYIHRLVYFWSYRMDRHEEEELAFPENHLWTNEMAWQAVKYGNRAALMSCWKELKESVRHRMVIKMAFESLQHFLWHRNHECRLQLVSYCLPRWGQSYDVLRAHNLPSHYTELMRFFLSQMDEEQQLTFFKQAFESHDSDVLECFLEWPLQDDFLSTINRLWGMVPKDVYEHCLLTLGKKYSGNSCTWVNEKEKTYYDYRSMLWALWEDAPEEYRRYVFLDEERDDYTPYSMDNKGNQFLSLLLERSPFQEKDEAFFKRVFCNQPQEVRRAIMLCEEVRELICLTFTKIEKLSFMYWLLEECLSKEEISIFKEKFINLWRVRHLCCSKLADNRERLVEDLIDWCFELDSEKTQYRYSLISGRNCTNFLFDGKFAELERVINFCVPSGERKEPIKVRFAQNACEFLLENCAWEQMDTILAWIGADAEGTIRDLKGNLFSNKGIAVHYNLVFVRREWKEVERFYKWFDLPPEEIKKLKKDTFCTPEVIAEIGQWLYGCTDTLVASLLWCLTDEKMVIDLKKEVEEQYFKQPVSKKERKKKKRLDCLVSELLNGFGRKEEVRDRACKVGVFMKDKREKRSISTEDDSSSPRKRFKQNI